LDKPELLIPSRGIKKLIMGVQEDILELLKKAEINSFISAIVSSKFG
tara:strand:- start:391 stop:531 length:141 start_codon:yes stop_codon:yes gene_type:complete